MKRILSGLALIAAIAIVTYMNRAEASSSVDGASIDSGIAPKLLETAVENGQPDVRLTYTGMKISFNPDAHEPNWVAWELTQDETNGDVSRTNKFFSDPDVDGCATTYDYRGSGYDRGHMAPAGDMKWSEKAMEESFLLTNICPQAHKLNSGSWKKLEEHCRAWAQRDSAIVIVCGPVLTDEIMETIGTTGVAVPQRFFKVVLAPYANPPRAIGFVMNNGEVKGGMQGAACSVDDVEAITGLDFFAALPDSIEEKVESRFSYRDWR